MSDPEIVAGLLNNTLTEEDVLILYTGMCIVIARVYARGRHEFDDLFQVCQIALIKTCRNVHRMVDTDFKTFAQYHMNVDCIEFTGQDHLISIPRRTKSLKKLDSIKVETESDNETLRDGEAFSYKSERFVDTTDPHFKTQFYEVLEMSCQNSVQLDIMKRKLQEMPLEEIANYYQRSKSWAILHYREICKRFREIWDD